MFELTDTEFKNWRSQFVASKGDKMGLRYKPMVFTIVGGDLLNYGQKNTHTFGLLPGS
jgi:hypothetical protein